MDYLKRLLGRGRRPEKRSDIPRPNLDPRDREVWFLGDRLVDDWVILDVIDSGGMGTIYVVAEPSVGLPKAAKTFKRRFFSNPSAIEVFKLEAETWVQLGSHVNIVSADYVLDVEGIPFVFVEYVPGQNLRELMLSENLSLERVLDLSLQFCRGMSHVHSRDLGPRGVGVLHCDIKPENTLVAAGDILKITDFGLAKGLFSIETDSGRGRGDREPEGVGGTPLYMSPEHFRGPSHLGVFSDIYSFGILLYELLSGSPPFAPTGDSPTEIVRSLRRQHLETPTPGLQSIRGNLPGLLKDTVFDCLRKEADARPQSFAVIEKRLSKVYKSTTGKDYARDLQVEQQDFEKLDLARSYLNLGKPQEALSLCEEALQAVEGDQQVAIHQIKGLCHADLGDAEAAIAAFDRALAIQPDYIHSWNSKANAYFHLEKHDQAIECLEEALRINPDFWQSFQNMGALLDTLGRHEESLEWFDRALRFNPRHVNSLASKGNVLQKMGRYDEAIRLEKKALSINPRDANALNNMLIISMKTGDFDEALKWSNRLIETNPKLPTYWYNRAVALMRKDLLDDALAAISEGLDYASDRVRLLELKLRVVADIIQRRAEPIYHRELYKCAETILELEPSHQVALGIIQLSSDGGPASLGGEVSEAKKLNLQGEAILNMKRDIVSAVALFQKAIELEPNLMDSYNNMGVALEMFERPKEAIPYYDKTIELAPDFHMPWYNKGNCHKDLGLFREAIECFDEALSLESGFVNTWLNKGFCLFKLGEIEAAKECYGQALTLDPGNPKILRTLEALRSV